MSAAADVDHRLDRDDEALLELVAAGSGRPVVRDLRLLVHGGADAVADVLPHDREAARLRDPLHRGADVAEAVADDDLLDRGVERRAG